MQGNDFYYIFIIWQSIGFMRKMTFQIFIETRRFKKLWVRRNAFFKSACLSLSFCQHNNFLKNYRIELRFGTLLEGWKRKDELVNHLFFTNGSAFIHQKAFWKK